MHWIDPESLPAVAGTLDRFVLNPHGEVDGFVMSCGTEDVLVHVPPHMETELVRHVRAGETVTVRGVRPRGAALLAAVAVIAQDGHWIDDHGPGKDRKHPKVEHRTMTAEGTIRLALFGPKGELRGALLADGTSVRIGPKEAEHIKKLLAPGSRLIVRGDGLETKHGRVIHAREAGPTRDELAPVKAPKKDKPKPVAEAHAA
ncbi:hypothetical protein [Bradyrhizobium sp.]|uniref:hypothetical protein n=1 Tax=Bradyrhizobium sp. TaxID=376 RepID=UPI001ED5E296|nr:hypothetical protein [Bradyrhizobium sp.]MBV8919935.1 hypothetical protein [Bradyrhizobium sp.]MBV9982838.1 hypothetical protein [Bradyrhizobium sp.]